MGVAVLFGKRYRVHGKRFKVKDLRSRVLVKGRNKHIRSMKVGMEVWKIVVDFNYLKTVQCSVTLQFDIFIH